MMTITSKAGARLARAAAALDRWHNRGAKGDTTAVALRVEYAEAARQVADELVEQGFHDLDGGEG
ncbi:hypothetical protein [Halomonas sp.]|uniref:hypothetical protein n=1 Tax=Halomonas sp. TaxID=1486246 RepID=UPI003D12DB99